MATNKLEKEKLKLVHDKCQSILSDLLRDEDNKYCVDCDAKGPRWASWNLGIFLCIRCAGIHRNLGVHISKVKSVNLDAWTPEQIACLQNMGNSKARAVYEANLPDNFRRPQTDSSLEAFVRAKYEQKKYIAKEWVEPPPPKPAFDIEEELRKEKERKRNKNKPFQSAAIADVQASNPLPRPNSSPAGTVINADKIPQEVMKRGDNEKNSTLDLLGLDVNNSASDAKSDDDSFGVFVSSVGVTDTTDSSTNGKTDSKVDEESDFFNQKAPTDEKKVMSKESILSLYGSAPPPQHSILNAPQTTPYNTSNQSLFMGQFVPNPPVNAPQTGMFLPQNNVNTGIQPPQGQSTNLMSQSIFPLTTNPFLANNSTNISTNISNFGQQSVTQLPQHMASLQMNPMSANISNNQIPSNNLFAGGPISGILPVPPPGVINPFMTSAQPFTHPSVPVVNNFSGLGLNTGPMFSQPDASPQWAFNVNTPINQPSGVTASSNLWQ